MAWDQLRDRAEHLLREPNNLFGPPTGRGYDYFRAGLTVVALILAALSGWCLMAPGLHPGLHPALTWLLLLLGAPFCIGVWFLWPANLLFGWAGAAVVWYATLHTAVWVTGFRQCGGAARYGWAGVAVVGWLVGAGLTIALWQ